MELFEIIGAVLIGTMTGAMLAALSAPDWLCGMIAGAVAAYCLLERRR